MQNRRTYKKKINNSCINSKNIEPKINPTNSKNIKNVILKTVINPEIKKATKEEEKISKPNNYKTTKVSNKTSLKNKL